MTQIRFIHLNSLQSILWKISRKIYLRGSFKLGSCPKRVPRRVWTFDIISLTVHWPCFGGHVKQLVPRLGSKPNSLTTLVRSPSTQIPIFNLILRTTANKENNYVRVVPAYKRLPVNAVTGYGAECTSLSHGADSRVRGYIVKGEGTIESCKETCKCTCKDGIRLEIIWPSATLHSTTLIKQVIRFGQFLSKNKINNQIDLFYPLLCSYTAILSF